MAIRILGLFIVILSISYSGSAQETPTPIDSLDLSILDELEMDTLTLIDLIDSLMSFEPITSQISVNAGYISQITSSGRDLDINQFGFNSGIGYYHKSGWFATINGFWYSDFEPAYSLTAFSAGYLKLINKQIGIIASVDHSIYTDKSLQALNNSGNLMVILDLGKLEFYNDYALYFGNGTAHRINPGINLDLKVKKLPFFDQLFFRPAFNVIFGDTEIVNTQLLSTDDANFERYLRFRPRLANYLGDNPTQEQIDIFLALYPRAAEFIEYSNQSIFGLMNYAFSVPITLSKNQFSFHANYTYNVPRALPGELFELSPNDYISLSLSYKFSL